MAGSDGFELPNLPTVVAVLVGLLWFADLHAWAALVLVLGLAVYAYACIAFPWARCPPQMFLWGGCGATGEQHSPFSDHVRTCRKCDGRKRVVRLGRRVWTWSTDVNEDRK